MCSQAITFRDLLAPLTAEAFFERTYDRDPVYLPGPDDKLASVFSWPALNSLLNMPNVWSGKTMTIVRDGQALPPQAFCRPINNREGDRAMQADPAKVRAHLRDGAAIVLSAVEALNPALASVSAALQVWFGGPMSCRVHGNWQRQPEGASNFETKDVVVLHIAGSTTWRIYDGRFEQPAEMPGYETTRIDQDYHERSKGSLRETVAMSPGDVLYLPSGQYHDTVITDEASLHLTFSVTQATGYDLLSYLSETLIADPLFREFLPPFDDDELHLRHVRRLAERVRDAAADAATSDEIRQIQRRRAFSFCYPEYGLPNRADPVVYGVRSLGVKMVRRGSDHQLQSAAGKSALAGNDRTVAEWVLARDYFSAEELLGAFQEIGEGDLTAALETLGRAGIVAVI